MLHHSRNVADPHALLVTPDPRQWNVQQVQDWVESIGFHEYREAFAEASVNGRTLLGMTAHDLRSEVMIASEHSKLFEMEIAELAARHGVGKQLPLAEKWDAQGVATFLKDVGLGQYARSSDREATMLRLGDRTLKREDGRLKA